jgi:hypothetical protein
MFNLRCVALPGHSAIKRGGYVTIGKWLGAAVLAVGTTHAEDAGTFRVLFPLSLASDEQLESFNLVVDCGHIDTVSIPDMWNVRVDRAISGREELVASAGLGAAALSDEDVSRYNGKILVTTVRSTDCLDLTGDLVVRGVYVYRHVKLTKRDLHRIK